MMKLAYLEPIAPDVESLLVSERTVVRGPDELRQRAMSRARAALLAEAGSARTQPLLGFRWMAAAAVALAGASIWAAATRAKRAPVDSSRDVALTSPPRELAAPARAAAAVVSDALVPLRTLASPRAHTDPQSAELKVLRPARAAVADGDFTAALRVLAEHGRRFADGQLAEEREALRIRALSGLRRTDEARRVADAFRRRFPQSVLLSRMDETLRATP